MDGFDGLHAEDFTREDLDDVCAVFQGRDDAVQRRRTRHDGDAVAVAELDRFHVESRRDDELGAAEDGDARRDGVEAGAGADDDVRIVGIFLRKRFDRFMGPRRRES